MKLTPLEIIDRLSDNFYYILWIEGLSPQRGEKIAQVFPRQEYTRYNTRAVRFTKQELRRVVPKLNDMGVATWVFEQPSTYYPVKYVPAGTRYTKLSTVS
jgi:hypothetical protein